MVNTRQTSTIEPTTPNHQRDDIEGSASDIPRNSSSQEEKRVNGSQLDQIKRIMGSMVGVMQGIQPLEGRPSSRLNLYR